MCVAQVDTGTFGEVQTTGCCCACRGWTKNTGYSGGIVTACTGCGEAWFIYPGDIRPSRLSAGVHADVYADVPRKTYFTG